MVIDNQLVTLGYINIIHQFNVTMYLKSLFPSPGRVKSPSPDLTLSIKCLLDCTSRIMACQSRIDGRGSEERIADDDRHQTDLRDRDHRQRPSIWQIKPLQELTIPAIGGLDLYENR